MKEHGEKVPAEERSKVESAVRNLKDVMKGDEAGAIQKAVENVMTASQALGKIIYEEAAKHAAPTGAEAAAGAPDGEPGTDQSRAREEADTGGEAKKDEDVIDAEFEVKE